MEYNEILLYKNDSCNYLQDYESFEKLKNQMIVDLPRLNLQINKNKITCEDGSILEKMISNYWNYKNLPKNELKYTTQAVFAPALEILKKKTSKFLNIVQNGRVSLKITVVNNNAIIENLVNMKYLTGNKFFKIKIKTFINLSTKKSTVVVIYIPVSS
tara:strand:- start:454 stop:927 length:474 start_codon:yes stop_codon:yes gene_type:complete